MTVGQVSLSSGQNNHHDDDDDETVRG